MAAPPGAALPGRSEHYECIASVLCVGERSAGETARVSPALVGGRGSGDFLTAWASVSGVSLPCTGEWREYLELYVAVEASVSSDRTSVELRLCGGTSRVQFLGNLCGHPAAVL